MIFYITGGERSGKSNFAQQLALQHSNAPKYVATSRIWDDDHQKRIDRHKADRDDRWTSVEEEKLLSTVIGGRRNCRGGLRHPLAHQFFCGHQKRA